MTRGFDRLAAELQSAEHRRASGVGRRSRVRSGLLPLATTVVVAAVLAVVLLSGSGAPHAARTGAGPASSRGPSAAPVRSGWRLPCAESVGTQAPPAGTRVLLGVVALPGSPGESRALQTGRDGARLFAKSGLWVRNGATFELTIPSALRSRLTMTWGSAGEGNHGAVMTDGGCRVGHTRWLNYVGGYWVRHQLCATLIVTSGTQRRRVRIGIGTGCPGQRGPHPPSQSFG